MTATPSILQKRLGASDFVPAPQFVLDLSDELIIDNFAGGGGASTGIYLAIGRHVDHAINHDRFALGMHRINHPQTIHHCEDIFEVDPATICEGRRVGLVHSSPDCKHFSKAKGGTPLNKKIRGLVLVMLKWAKYGARVMTMENVEEIVTWGPLKRMRKNGSLDWYADPEHKGRTWQAFLSILSTGIDPAHPDLPEILEVLGGYVTREECVRGFGYAYEGRVIRACDQGTPTIRKRFYLVARRDGRPIVWPAPSHQPRESTTKGAKETKRARGQKKLPPYRAIAECIDWELPCPSIFLDKAGARRWRCKRPLARATLRRIARGTDKHILRAAKPFIVSVTHQGGDRDEAIDEPGRTVTGAHRGEKAVVAPTVVNTANSKTTGRGPNTWSPEEPGRTITSAPGFAVSEAALAPFVTEHANATHQRNFPADEPARTACAQVKGGHFAAVAASLVHTAHGDEDKNGKKRGRGEHAVTETSPSVLASPDFALAAASMIKLRGDAETHSAGSEVTEPGHTASAGGQHHGLIAASIVREFGQSVGHGADEPAHTVTAGGGGKTGLISATIFGAGGRAAQSRERGVDEVFHTTTAKGDTCLAAAYLAQHNGGEVGHQTTGHDARDPFSTISAKGSQQQVTAAALTKYYGTDQDPRLEEPGHTVTTKDRFGLVESTGVCPLTEEQLAGARRVAAFLREHGVKFEGEFATVAGYVIVDLGMRMLTPRELFRAQGFGNEYIIDRAWVVDPKTGEVVEIHLTKEQQIRMCGNSVCPQVLRDIVAGNVPELMVRGFTGKARRRGVRREGALA